MRKVANRNIDPMAHLLEREREIKKITRDLANKNGRIKGLTCNAKEREGGR